MVLPCPVFNEVNDDVVDGGLPGGVATFAPIHLEAQEVAVAGQRVQLIASGCRFTFDDSLPSRSTFKPHHGFINSELTRGDEVRWKDALTMVIERRDLLDHCMTDISRGWWCDMKVAKELFEASSRESGSNIELSPSPGPIHMQ